MTLVLVDPAEEGRPVEFENRALGVPESGSHADEWRQAMADEAFVRDQEELLEEAAAADAEVLD
jgi:hypothetical protein